MICLLVYLSVVSAVSAVHLPSYLVPCSKRGNFSACAMKHAEDAIPHLLNGDRSLGLPKFTPLRISLIEVKGANNFNVNLTNLKVYGLENTKPLKMQIDFAKKRAQVLSTVPRLVVLGDYIMRGKIMIFNLNGYGPVNITLTNGIYEYGFEWVIETRDGVEYGKIINSNFDYNLKGVSYHFANVINGEKELSEQINLILNKNWEIVNEDLKESICKTLLSIHNQLFSLIFTKVPYRELFLE